MIESQSVLVTLAVIAISLSAPVLWAALGELISEESGIINPGIEGVMLIGALAATIGFYLTRSLVLSLGASLTVGVVSGLILGYLYIWRAVDQIITGILFNVGALGLTTTLFANLDFVSRAGVVTATNMRIPGFADIPFVGPILFRQDAFFYASIVTTVAVYLLIRKTWFGLSLRAAGEHPRAVETAGINIWSVRYLAVILGCVLPSVGGAVLVLSIVGGFNVGMTAGQGFIALGIVVLARWNPLAVAGGALLFGLAQALQFQGQAVAVLRNVPVELWFALPYLVTIGAVLVARGSQYPSAVAMPYPPRTAALGKVVNRVRRRLLTEQPTSL